MNVQGQSKATENQITANKPNVEKSSNLLSGYISGSMNGGINKVMGWKQIMAGERHREMRLQTRIKLLTPLTPAYMPLRIKLSTFFVPYSRVWDNAEAFTAQRGGTTETKIAEMPNFGGKIIPKCKKVENNNQYNINYSDTTLWRDGILGDFFPRINPQNTEAMGDIIMPKYEALNARAFFAVYNDYLRNKEYDEEVIEYKGDTVSNEEWNRYFLTTNSDLTPNQYFKRAKKNNSYYSDYRTDMQGWEIDKPTDADNELLTWMAWESKADMVRNSAEFAQMNTWEIIAKLRGSKLLTQGKTQHLSTTVHTLNYSSITQSTYNNNENIQEKFRVMGQQGAYSYTELNVPLYAGHEFDEEGVILVIGTVYADTVYESGLNRLELNVNAFDRYRPDLKDDKLDTIYISEFGTTMFEMDTTEISNYYRAVGFKRKFSEYFYLPNIVGGDILSTNWFSGRQESTSIPLTTTEIIFEKTTETEKTYQLFEIGGQVAYYSNTDVRPKKIWLDYTDFVLNKNQVIPNAMDRFGNDFFIQGENQINYLGYMQFCI